MYVTASWEIVGRRKEMVKRRKREKLDLIVCGRIYGFICKMLTCHFQIGGCKTGVLHPVLIEFNLFIQFVNQQRVGGFSTQNDWVEW